MKINANEIRSGIVEEMKSQLLGKMNGTAAPAAKQSPSSPNKSGTLGGLSNFKAPDGAPQPPALPLRFGALPSKAKNVGAEVAGAALQAGSQFLPGPAGAVMHAAGGAVAAAAAPGVPGGGGDPIAQMRADQKQAIKDQAEIAKIQQEGNMAASSISRQSDLLNGLVKQMEKGTKQIAEAIAGRS